MNPLSIISLTDILNQGAAIKTAEEILTDLFGGNAGGIKGAFLAGLQKQLDGAAGTAGAKSLARSVMENIDASMEPGTGTVEQRIAVGTALAQNAAAQLANAATLLLQYSALQAAVETAKAANDNAALSNARSARDLAVANLKTAFQDVSRVSAGQAAHSFPPKPAPAPPPAQ